MNQEWLYDDETLEDLQLQGLKLIQKKEGFRFGMDSVLLAHFAQIGCNDLDHVCCRFCLSDGKKDVCLNALKSRNHM